MELTIKENGVAAVSLADRDRILAIEEAMRAAKQEFDNYRKELLGFMESNNIRKIEMPGLTITYIDPTDREMFDKKTFRTDNPDLYDHYAYMAPVKSTVRVKVGE